MIVLLYVCGCDCGYINYKADGHLPHNGIYCELKKILKYILNLKDINLKDIWYFKNVQSKHFVLSQKWTCHTCESILWRN